MKSIRFAIASALLLTLLQALAYSGVTQSLPSLTNLDRTPLFRALETRKIRRKFLPAPISTEQLSTLLWSMTGVTWRKGASNSVNGIDAETGATISSDRKTVPFIFEKNYLRIYVLDSNSCSLYSPESNTLTVVKEGDFREGVGRSGLKPPVVLLLTSNLPELPIHYSNQKLAVAVAFTTAGMSIQNALLASETLGLGCSIRSVPEVKETVAALGLPDKELPMYFLYVGRPDKN